jgi:hypothetical protein
MLNFNFLNIKVFFSLSLSVKYDIICLYGIKIAYKCLMRRASKGEKKENIAPVVEN